MVKEKVQRYLIDLLETSRSIATVISLPYGSAHVFVSVEPFGDDRTFISVVGTTNQRRAVEPGALQAHRHREPVPVRSPPLPREGRQGLGHIHAPPAGRFPRPRRTQDGGLPRRQTADEVDDEIVSKFGGKQVPRGLSTWRLPSDLALLLDHARAEAKRHGHDRGRPRARRRCAGRAGTRHSSRRPLVTTRKRARVPPSTRSHPASAQ